MTARHATAWANVARVVKTQGLKGEVVVVPIDGLPFLVSEGMHVTLTPPPLRGPRDVVVRSVRELSNGWGVSFSGIENIDDASKVAGKLVLARRDELACDLAGLECAPARHRSVHDEKHGDLGRIVDAIANPAYDVWVVHGPLGEVMIPAVDEMIVDVPEDESLPIEVRLPEGLVPEVGGSGPEEPSEGGGSR
jgi:16S rRNA processing protein RimM